MHPGRRLEQLAVGGRVDREPALEQDAVTNAVLPLPLFQLVFLQLQNLLKADLVQGGQILSRRVLGPVAGRGGRVGVRCT